MNDDKVAGQISFCEKFNQESRPKIKANLQALINKAKNKAKKTSNDEQKIVTRKVEDPREGVTRRFANYIPIKRYQYVKRIAPRSVINL